MSKKADRNWVQGSGRLGRASEANSRSLLIRFRCARGLKGTDTMAVLTTKARKKLPASSFALPGKGEGPTGKGAGSYPIPDKGHAKAALSLVSQHGTSEEKARVRAKVKAKYPAMQLRRGAVKSKD
jgi:hypothetical protein